MNRYFFFTSAYVDDLQAKSKLNDTEQALNLEAEIRKLRDEVKETEMLSRTLTTELEDKQDELKQERDAIDRFKEKVCLPRKEFKT